MDKKTLQLIKTKDRASEAKFDGVGLCVARLLDDMGGNGEAVKAMMADLMDDRRRLGGVTLTLLEMIHTLANGRPNGFAELVTYLVDAIPEMV